MLDTERHVKLQRPTDFLILECLQDGRNVAVNIAQEIDKSRSHVNVRLPQLEDYRLVEKVGPSDNSGLYEITELGVLAVENRNRYGDVDDFEAYLKQFRNEREHSQ
ncbi:winged helix-turn-helix domain-containing protein [Halomicrobium salinisoli]|uniref:winged helix-turn-helix domain-containing protein n=1 Tax=Halomicrobium salinisoli TaxID=2878391 RepID=UPI001CF062BF|nr:winged helix-turn-helix domain-containing protein [Halomicrobium salinisoli]